jgi:hypothetical protein
LNFNLFYGSVNVSDAIAAAKNVCSNNVCNSARPYSTTSYVVVPAGQSAEQMTISTYASGTFESEDVFNVFLGAIQAMATVSMNSTQFGYFDSNGPHYINQFYGNYYFEATLANGCGGKSELQVWMEAQPPTPAMMCDSLWSGTVTDLIWGFIPPLGGIVAGITNLACGELDGNS